MRKTLILAVLGILLLPATARGQVTVNLAPVPRQQYFSVSGAPLASGCILTSQSGTNTPLTAYADGNGFASLPNPIILDAGGFATIYLQNAAYRFTVTAYDGIPGNKCAAGVQQYVVDNINAFDPIDVAANLFLAGQSSDPAGTGGEMIYRNDIPCFRFFTTFWDCVVRLTDTQTLTNKTLASPTLTGTTSGLVTTGASLTTPSVNNVTVQNTPGTYITVANDATTGTTLNTLTKLLAATTPQAVIAATADTSGIIGITVSGAGKTGTATIQQSGVVNCIFDNSVTNGNYVVNGTGGDCHAQAQYPITTQAVGKVLATGAAGTYPMILFSPEIVIPAGRVAIADLTAQNANITSTPIFTPTVAGLYRFSCYEVITTAATTSSTLPQCNLGYTDSGSNVAESIGVCASSTANVAGQVCGQSVAGAVSVVLFPKGGVSVNVSTSGYASVGATQMVYEIHYRLEGPL